MGNSLLFLTNMDLDGGWTYILPTESHSCHGFGGHLLPHIGSFVDISCNHSRYFYIPGSLALQEAFSFISKFSGTLLLLFRGTNSNFLRRPSGSPHGSTPRNCQSCTQVKHVTSCRHNLVGSEFRSRSSAEPTALVLFGKITRSTIRNLWKEVEQLQSFPMLSLAAALVPPFDNFSSKVLAVPLENTDEQINGHMDQTPCEEHQGCASVSLSDVNWTRNVVEPRTGIKFPAVLDNRLVGDNDSRLTSEVLVGIGARSIKIVRVKSLEVYAFGLYVQPDSVCEKLGQKYASVPISELKNCQDFFEDLLREDIHMTVRLVINCNGLKIDTVRDVFERSLRARLLKVNPNTDFRCLRTFNSYFPRNISLPAGTTIDFRRTANGQLITEIGGKQIGAVHSKDLCRAFFDMYIGDVPVSVQVKQEIARNVGVIFRRCYAG